MTSLILCFLANLIAIETSLACVTLTVNLGEVPIEQFPTGPAMEAFTGGHESSGYESPMGFMAWKAWLLHCVSTEAHRCLLNCGPG